MNETILDILKELHEEVDFESCESLIDDKILDSFDIITLISEINARLDIAVPAEMIIPENFNSARALSEMVEKLSEE